MESQHYANRAGWIIIWYGLGLSFKGADYKESAPLIPLAYIGKPSE